MAGQLDAAIDSDFAELKEGFRIGGARRVAALIEGRVKGMPSGPMFYLLEDPAGRMVAGNLPPLPVRIQINATLILSPTALQRMAEIQRGPSR